MVQPGVPQGKVTKHTWESTIFPNTTRDYWVYVPAQYDGSRPAAVMVFQDGEGCVNPNGTIRVPTLEGDVEMTVPAGSSSGRILRLRGRGWPTGDGERGDELVELRLTVPERLTEEQKKLYEQLLESEAVAQG